MMIKNFIIYSLIMLEVSHIPGWAVSGFKKFLVCEVLALVLTFLTYEVKESIKSFMED